MIGAASMRAFSTITAVTGANIFVVKEADAFLPPTPTANIIIRQDHREASLFMGKTTKPSMRERRKNRAKRQPGFQIDRGSLSDFSPVDEVVVATSTTLDGDNRLGVKDDESQEIATKASSLIESQRKSVECLAFIRKRVEESFPVNDAARAIVDRGYFAYDGFLSSGDDEAFGDELLSQMVNECSDMLSNDKLTRDTTRLVDGEYVANIIGGEAYVDCPRLTEYVVSLTRHLPPLLNNAFDDLAASDISELDATASMATLRMYDRKTMMGADTDDYHKSVRPFGVICGDNEGIENDTRRLTAMLFLSSNDWDASRCGGGVTVENGERLTAIRDRIIILRSDTCSHCQEPWNGEDKAGLEQASCVVVHFVKRITPV
ncbi:hypothetical protein ACHAW5_002306 [Stephanodiscus triporus]|uniref:Prolyl 4-hydroxylase alpha subunit domain-containing protein n=1 Tax=Stephanodiscus triporus TaxID=2934178 RepID=A0ABD3MJU7_9STRA